MLIAEICHNLWGFFFLYVSPADRCLCHDHGCRAGVCYPAKHNWETTVWSGQITLVLCHIIECWHVSWLILQQCIYIRKFSVWHDHESAYLLSFLYLLHCGVAVTANLVHMYFYFVYSLQRSASSGRFISAPGF